MSAGEALSRACERLWAAGLPAGRPPGPTSDLPTVPAAGSPSIDDSAVAALGSALRRRQVSCEELARRALRRAEAASLTYGCFVELYGEAAIAAARARDRELAAGRDRGPLHGIPTAVKDVIDLEGRWTRLGTERLGHHRATADARICAHLLAAGAVAIGKTTTHELAWGATTPGTGNPAAPGRIAGGSSGGSAAAVAAGVVPFALGTDTGGSIRIPAALCGVAALRTTHGALDLGGIAALAPSQDTVGPLAGRVADCELVARLAGGAGGAGGDPGAGAARPSVDAAAGMRLGVLVGGWAERVAPGVEATVAAAHAALAESGVELVPVEVELAALAPAVSYVVMLAEASRVWGGSRARRERAGSETEELLEVGATVAAVDYLRAREVGRAIAADFEQALARRRLAALLLPTTPVAAPPVGATAVEIGAGTEPVEGALGRLCALASVTGAPALSVPVGVDGEGLPIGMQVLAARGREDLACAVGTTVERVCGQFAGQAPPSTLIEDPLT